MIIERKTNIPANCREIFLAGGCFWGVEKYFSKVRGVAAVSVGYANCNSPNNNCNSPSNNCTHASPTYEEVCTGATGCAETAHIIYNPEELPLSRLLDLFMQAIDPTSLNQQGGDIGEQYRTGIYYLDEADLPEIRAAIEREQREWKEKIVVETLPLQNYFLAEEYHQEYLKKNPAGYCHIGDDLCNKAWGNLT